MPFFICSSLAPMNMYCSIFSRRTSKLDKPAVLFFILYAARPPPPTPNSAAPALNVASTANRAVDDAVVAPVSAAIPPIPAARAGAASPPVIAKTVPRANPIPAIFADLFICLTREAVKKDLLTPSSSRASFIFSSSAESSRLAVLSFSLSSFSSISFSSTSCLKKEGNFTELFFFCCSNSCSRAFISCCNSLISRSSAMRKRTISIATRRSISSNLRVARYFALERRLASTSVMVFCGSSISLSVPSSSILL